MQLFSFLKNDSRFSIRKNFGNWQLTYQFQLFVHRKKRVNRKPQLLLASQSSNSSLIKRTLTSTTLEGSRRSTRPMPFRRTKRRTHGASTTSLKWMTSRRIAQTTATNASMNHVGASTASCVTTTRLCKLPFWPHRRPWAGGNPMIMSSVETIALASAEGPSMTLVICDAQTTSMIFKRTTKTRTDRHI